MSKLPRHRRPLIEALEPRLLFSATADIAVFDDGASDGHNLAQAAEQVDLVSIYMPAEPLVADSQASDVEPQDDLPLNENERQAIATVVFVDTAVTDYETLVEDIRARLDDASVAVVYLDSSKDGVAQISDYLAGVSGVSAIHIISHSVAGNLQLGTQVLNENNIAQFKQQLTSWQTAMGDEADILLYGCDLAANDSGLNLLRQLSDLTGADVAASNDLTGNNRADADWVLEEKTGVVETQSLFAANEPMEWQGVLADIVHLYSGAPTNEIAIPIGGDIKQGVQLSTSTIVDRVQISLANHGTSASSVTMLIRPGGYSDPPIATASVSTSTIGGSLAQVNFDFQALTLDPYKIYWIEFRTNDGADNKVGLGYINQDVIQGVFVINNVSNSLQDMSIALIDVQNTAPTVSIGPTDYSADEQTRINLHGTGIAVADVDGDVLTVTLTGQHGTSTLRATAGTTGVEIVSGVDTNNLVIRGTATQLNELFAGNGGSTLSYRLAGDTPASTDTLTIKATDGGNLSGTDTAIIHITALNDDPQNTVPPVQSTNEDTALVFSSANLNQIQVNDLDVGNANLEITLAVTNGTLTLAGIAGLVFTSGDGTADNSMVFRGTKTNVNLALATLTFNPTANFTGTAVLTLTTSDLGSVGSGGILTDTDTVNITVAPVNDVPTGTNKTVTTNEDTGYTFAASDFGFSDIDSGDSLSAVRIDSLPVVGSLTLGGNAVTAGQVITSANIGTLVFTPAANANGTSYANFTFSVRDQAGAFDAAPNTLTVNVTAVNDAPVAVADSITLAEGGTATTLVGGATSVLTNDTDAEGNALTAILVSNVSNGSLTLNANGTFSYTHNGGETTTDSFTYKVRDGTIDGNTVTVSINVTPVNDAPTGADKTVTINEDAGYTFVASDFGFSDLDSGDSLSAVRIDSLPAAGSLTLGGVAVTAGQVITSASIGTLVFTPAANANGASYAGFTFSVRDQSSVFDATPNAITINVTAVNDAPTGADKTVTTNEDTGYTFAASDFGFSDLDSGDSLSAVRIDSLPVAGSLTLSGVAVTAGQVVTTANIGSLVFTPAANANGASYAGFTFSVRDQSSVFDVAPNTITINVTAQNDAPTGADKTVTTNEDTGYTFAASDFGFSDIDSGDSLLAVRIDSLPAAGSLTLGGVAVTAGQVITSASIGSLVFTPAANANGASYANFTFSVRDQSSVFDATPNAITINVTAQDDAPTGANKTVTTNEDTGYTFAASDFGFSDLDSGDSLSAVRIDILPVAGSLTLSGVAVTAGQVISSANIGTLVFTPAADANGASYAGFTFSVRDQSSVFDVVPNVITINVMAQNDAPTGADKTVTTNEDTGYTFAASDFGFSDLDSGDSLSAVRIDSLPVAGSLSLGGIAVTAGQVITSASIGTLVFTPAANANGASYAGFTFSVRDQSSVFDAAPNAITINVTAQNDAPAGSNTTLSLTEDGSHVFTAGNFGFSDINDSPANSLSAVTISTLPGVGSLTLSGVAVTLGQSISLANITAGNLVYTPAANANGSGYSSFTFQVQDNGGTANGGVNIDPTPNTITLDVTAVNDAPINSVPGVQITLQNTDIIFSTGNGNQIQIADVDAGLNNLEVTLSVMHGTLTLASVVGLVFPTGDGTDTLVLTGTLADINTALATLTYSPTLGYTGSDELVVTTSDLGSSGSGGAQQDVDTIDITVTNVNDPPAVNITQGNYNAIEQQALSLTGSGISVSDPDGNPLTLTLSATGAASQLHVVLGTTGVSISSGDGTNTLVLTGSIAQLNTLLAGNNGGGLTYTYSGDSPAASETLTITVSDGQFDVDDTAIINIIAVNDAPDGTDASITLLEGGAHTLTAANFGFSDIADSPANALAAVRIASLPAAGSLTLNAVAVNIGDFISIADINSGLLVYTPVTNGNGTGYASFTFQVQDDGGTANGGIALDPVVNSLTFDVTAVNDAPSGSDTTLSLTEDGSHIFTAANFGFSDINDSPANSLLAVTISSLPGAGSLTLGGFTVIPGQSISLAAITAGDLVFTPIPDANGTGYSSFTFQVQDNGGTANTGVDLDATPNTITLDVTAVNDAPAGSDITLTIAEDGSHIFTAANFGFSDASDSPANSLLGVTINTLPSAGNLRLDGVAVTLGQSIGLTDITAGKLVFTPAANANGTGYSSFTFQVQDNGGTANGGVNIDPAPNTITLDVTAVNDAPAGSDATLSLDEDSSHIFTAANFGFSDTLDSPANSFLAVTITSLPGAGSFRLNGVDVTPGQIISLANITAGNLVFTPAANASGTGYSSFTFQVQDNGGTADGGVDLDPIANTISFDVTSVNDAPAGSNTTLTITEDGSHVFTAANFGFSDTLDSPANSLLAVTISTLPSAGNLRLDGVAVTLGLSISLTDITAGKLVFTPAANANGIGYSSFTFQVQDNGGTANGGVNLDSSPNTITLDVTAVNDAPAGGDTTLTIAEDGNHVITAANFGFTDTNDNPANNLLAVTISTLPSVGGLTLDGVAVTLGQSINLADITAGNLIFTPVANANGSGYSSFTFQVQDSGGTTNGGVDLDPSPNTITVDVTAVNDAPVAISDTVITLNEGSTATTLVGGASSVLANDTDAEGNTLSAILVSNVTNGSLTLNSDGTFSYTHNGGESTSDSFTYKVNDGTVDGNTVTVSINITPLNDAPVAVAETVITLFEGGTATTLVGGASSVLANDTDAEGNTLSAILVSNVTNGSLTLNADGTFSYTHNGGESTTDSFTYKVNDGTVDGNTVTVSINITPVNDAPVAVAETIITLVEGSTATTLVGGASSVLANDTDAEGNSLTAILVSNVTNGSLTFNADGTFSYTHNGGETTTDSFSYKVNDGTVDGNTVTVGINITPLNDAPVAVAETVITLAEGGTATTLVGGASSVLANDTDAEGNTLSAILVSNVTNGSLTLNADGTFSYTHNGGESTTDSFTYKVNDGTVDGNTVTVSINITPVNDAPVAVAETIITLVEGSTATTLVGGASSVLANDTDAEGNALSAILVSNVINGSLTLNADGTFSYTHNGGETTTDSFSYKVNDGTVDGNTVTVNINITPVNDAPIVAVEIPDQSATEDQLFTFQFADTAFADIDGDTLTYTTGSLPAWLTFDAVNRTFSGTPANSDVGAISIDVSAADGNGVTVTDTFILTVMNINNLPIVGNPIPDQTATEDAAFNFQFAANSFADADPSDTLIYSAQLAGSGALPAWLSFDATTRTFSGTPANGDVGTLNIDVIASDGQGGTVTDTFALAIANTNDAPTLANPIADQTANEDAPFGFTITANTFVDIDAGSTLTYSVQPAGGGALPAWLSFDAATRTFSGTPTEADLGSVAVQVSVSDGQGGTASDTFVINVANINDAPVVVNPPANQTAQEDIPFTVIFGNTVFADADANTTLVYTAQLASGGALPAWLSFDAATLSFSGTPTNSDTGVLAISIVASDGLANTSAQFQLTVVATNDAPRTSGFASVTNQEDAAGDAVDLWAGFSDEETADNQLQFTVVSNSNPTLVSSAVFDAVTGKLQLRYGANQFGSSDLIIRAQDSQGVSVETSLRVNIDPVNDTPSSTGIADMLVPIGAAPQQTNLHDVFSDIEQGTQLQYALVGNSNTAVVTQVQIDAATGIMTLTFSSSVGGESIVTLRALDAEGAWVETRFKVTIISAIAIPVPETPHNNFPPIPPPMPPFEQPVVELPEVNPPGTGGGTGGGASDGGDPTNPYDSLSPYLPGAGVNSAFDMNDGYGLGNEKSRRDYLRLEDSLEKGDGPLLTLTASTALTSLIAPDAGFAPWETEDFDNEVRRIRSQMDAAMEDEQKRKAVVAGLTFSVTTGLLVWSLRASSLLLTLISMVPLWRGMDPLPILDDVNKKKKELEQQRKDREQEDKSSKEVGHIFDHAQNKKPSP